MGTKAEVPDKAEVWECILCEERVDLFNQGEKRCVQIVVAFGEFGVKEAGIDIADRDEFKGGVGREEDMRGNPIGRFPVPFGIRGTNKLPKVGTPISERDGGYVTSVG